MGGCWLIEFDWTYLIYSFCNSHIQFLAFWTDTSWNRRYPSLLLFARISYSCAQLVFDVHEMIITFEYWLNNIIKFGILDRISIALTRCKFNDCGASGTFSTSFFTWTSLHSAKFTTIISFNFVELLAAHSVVVLIEKFWFWFRSELRKMHLFIFDVWKYWNLVRKNFKSNWLNDTVSVLWSDLWLTFFGKGYLESAFSSSGRMPWLHPRCSA